MLLLDDMAVHGDSLFEHLLVLIVLNGSESLTHGLGDGTIHRAMLYQAWLLEVVQVYSPIDRACSGSRSSITATVLKGGRFLHQLTNILDALLNEVGDESRVRLVAITVLFH